MRLLIVLLLFSVAAAAFAALLRGPTCAPDQIIQKFAAKEAEFRKARENYTYKQSVKMEELDPSGSVQGKWEKSTTLSSGPTRQREEKVVYAPMNTLHSAPHAAGPAGSAQRAALRADHRRYPQYDIQYLGKEKLDEIHCYKFSVKPKKW